MPNMQLAFDHRKEMMEKYHAICFKEEDIDLDHRKISVSWQSGPCKFSELANRSLLQLLRRYETLGYRVLDTIFNGSISTIRLVRGALSALDEYRAKLESRSLTFFFEGAGRVDMEFVPRVGSKDLTPYEQTHISFLKTIKDFKKIRLNDNAMIFKVETYHSKTVKSCKDCQDGYYYPLVGPRESCQTCQTT